MTSNRPVSEMVERCPIPTKLRPYIDAYKMSAGQLGKWAEQFIHDHTDTTGYGWDRRWMGQRIREILDYVEANYVAAASGQAPSDAVVEKVARAMQPSLFGSPDSQVGPATLAERERHRKMAERAIAAIPSAVASDVVERAYREAWHEGYATGDAGGSYRAVENDWLASDARAAIAAIPSAGGVEEMREALDNFCRAAEYWAGCDEDCCADEAYSEILGSGGAWPAEAYARGRGALEGSPPPAPPESTGK